MKKWIAGISAAALMLSAAGTAVAAPAEDAPVLDCSTLVTFGDSLTALSSWPQDSAKELNMYLSNAGIGGNTSADALKRFERDVASKDPDFVTIAFGTNDFVRVNGTAPQVSLEDFRTNMETIVDKVEALDAIPILFTAPYVRDDPPPYQGNYENGLTAALDEYNAVIREIAADKGVYLVAVSYTHLDVYKRQVHQCPSLPGPEEAAQLPAQFGAHGDILQIGLGGGDAAGAGLRLVEGGMDTAVGTDYLEQAVAVGGLELGQQPVIQQGGNRRMGIAQPFQHLRVGGIAGFGFLLGRQAQFLE